MPRCISYNPFNCDLYIGCSSSSLYRLNLEAGRFMRSYQLTSTSTNKVIQNNFLNCIYAGGDNGVLDLVDFRDHSCQGRVIINKGQNITALSQFDNPYEFYAGSEEGLVALYDIRTNKPVLQKQHPYFFAINSIEFHSTAKKLITSDKKCIRVTEPNSDELFFMYEPKHEINNLKSTSHYNFIPHSHFKDIKTTLRSNIYSIFKF